MLAMFVLAASLLHDPIAQNSACVAFGSGHALHHRVAENERHERLLDRSRELRHGVVLWADQDAPFRFAGRSTLDDVDAASGVRSVNCDAPWILSRSSEATRLLTVANGNAPSSLHEASPSSITRARSPVDMTLRLAFDRSRMPRTKYSRCSPRSARCCDVAAVHGPK